MLDRMRKCSTNEDNPQAPPKPTGITDITEGMDLQSKDKAVRELKKFLDIGKGEEKKKSFDAPERRQSIRIHNVRMVMRWCLSRLLTMTFSNEKVR